MAQLTECTRRNGASVHRLAVFVNVTRADFCAWEEDEFEGPAPVGRLVPVKVKETGQGALVASIQSATEVGIELWQFDDDVPPFIGPCEDTDDQLEPWATGQARWMANDNDLDVSLSRMNSFGDRLSGKVVDGAGGRWHYSATFRAQITKDDEFLVRAEHTVLKSIGG